MKFLFLYVKMNTLKVIAENRIARFEYDIEERYEVGIELDGGEVKSVRAGQVSLKDSFCSIVKRSVFIKNMHVAVYDKAGAFNVKDAKRDRRLLLHRAEINKLCAKVAQKGYTLVPLKAYLKGSLIKLEIGLCRGKHTYEKKRTVQERDLKRETEREIKNFT